MFKNTPLYDRLRIWNNLRIQNRRLSLPFRKAAEGFMFKGLDVQFTDAWESRERALLQRLLPQNLAFYQYRGRIMAIIPVWHGPLGLPVVAWWNPSMLISKCWLITLIKMSLARGQP